MKIGTGVRITTARFKNFSIYRPSCMNAYKNSILEYGWFSALPGRRGGRWKSGDATHPRPPPWISNRRRAARSCMHFDGGESRLCIPRETPLVDDAERVRSFVPFFWTFMAYRIFPSATCATRSPHDIRRDWKGLSATRKIRCYFVFHLSKS